MQKRANRQLQLGTLQEVVNSYLVKQRVAYTSPYTIVGYDPRRKKCRRDIDTRYAICEPIDLADTDVEFLGSCCNKLSSLTYDL